MADAKLRYKIAFEAARLMYERVESEYFTAKRKAARRLGRDAKPDDLPSNGEIRELIQTFARMHEGERRTVNLRAMRIAALRLMHTLRAFRPRLIGSVLTGHVRKGSDIDLHVFSDSVDAVSVVLENEGLQYDVERKQIVKHGEERVFTHVHVFGTFNSELTVYAEDQVHYVFKSSITGKAIERASIRELEALLEREYGRLTVDAELPDEEVIDPWPFFRMLLLPLESTQQRREHHPEGDALYHSLQVFELARDERPYDEEFLLAALLHDVGKGIDPHDHVAAGLQALDGVITDRTRFFIEHHMQAHDYRAGALSPRQVQKLKASADFDDLLLFAQLDEAGRVPGVMVGTVDDALGYLQELERENAG
jgi:HD domain